MSQLLPVEDVKDSEEAVYQTEVLIGGLLEPLTEVLLVTVILCLSLLSPFSQMVCSAELAVKISHVCTFVHSRCMGYGVEHAV